MIIVVHGFPMKFKFHQLKKLISDICPIDDLVVDRFLFDGSDKKKVKIGCVNEEQANAIMTKLKGYNYEGSVLDVQPIGDLALNGNQGPDKPPFQGPNDGLSFQEPNDGPLFQGRNTEPSFQGRNNKPLYQAPNESPYKGPNNRSFQGPNNGSPYQGSYNRSFQGPNNESPYKEPDNGSFQGFNNGSLYKTPDNGSFQGPNNGPSYQGSNNGRSYQGPNYGSSYQGPDNRPPFEEPNNVPSFKGPPSLIQALPALGQALLKSLDIKSLDHIAHVQQQLELFNEWQANQSKRNDTPSKLKSRNDRFMDEQNIKRWHHDESPEPKIPDSPQKMNSFCLVDGRESPRPDDGRRDFIYSDRPENDYRRSKDMNRFSPGPRNIGSNSSPPHEMDSYEAYKASPSYVDDNDWTIGSKKGLDMGRSFSPSRGSRDLGRVSPLTDRRLEAYGERPQGRRNVGRIDSPPRVVVDMFDNRYKRRAPPIMNDKFIRRRSPGDERVISNREPRGKMGSPRDDFILQREDKLGVDSRRKESGRRNWSPRRHEVVDRNRSPNIMDVVSPKFDRYSPSSIFSDRDPVKSPPHVDSFRDQAIKGVDRNREKRSRKRHLSPHYSERDDQFDLRAKKRSLRTRSRSPVRRSHSRDRAIQYKSSVKSQNRAHSPIETPPPPTWPALHNDYPDEDRHKDKKTHTYIKSFDEFDIEGIHSMESKFDKDKKDTHSKHSGEYNNRHEEQKKHYIKPSDEDNRNVESRKAAKLEKVQDDILERKTACGQLSKTIMDRNKIEPHHKNYKLIFSQLKERIMKLINNKFEERTAAKIIMLEFPRRVTISKEDRLLQDVIAEINRNLKADVGVDSSKQSSLNNKPSIAQLHGLQQFSLVNSIMEPILPMQVPQINFDTNSLNVEQKPHRDHNESLLLRKLGLSAFTESEVSDIRDFVIAQIFEASTNEMSDWTPTITIKGLNTRCRYELKAEDEKSYKWLRKLDFTKFTKFDVLLYTKEEVWYERGYILLSNISGYSKMEPFEKLKLQNTFLKGVDIGKWKLVKKIALKEGIRIYVDMPPLCKKALEKYKMKLSYEFGKVYVVMRSSIIDTDKFDSDLLSNPDILSQTSNESKLWPSLPHINEKGAVLLCLETQKYVSITIARNIREKVLETLFEYLSSRNVTTRTDFLKCGYASSGYLAILPENKDSGSWFNDRFLGKVNGVGIVVRRHNDGMLYLSFSVKLPRLLNSKGLSSNSILTMIAKHTKHVKININKWIITDPRPLRKYNGEYEIKVDIDPESVDILHKHHFSLEVTICSKTHIIRFEHKCLDIKEYLNNYKTYNKDSYKVTNMDLDSD